MQVQTGDAIRDMRTIRKNQQEIQQIKTSATEVKNALHGLISILDEAEERVSEREDRSMETPQKDTQREWIKEKKKYIKNS